MKLTERTFHLRQFMNSSEGWGRVAGTVIQSKLATYIEDADAQLVRLAMDGVRKVDVTFASTVIVELIRQCLGKRAMCLVKLANDDVFENIAAAAVRMKVPVTIWHDGQVQVVGPLPSPGLREALAFALARDEVRAATFAAASGLAIANASTRFKQLWEQGFLMRREGYAASGGPEYVYRRIG